jgi:hypothetical protein
MQSNEHTDVLIANTILDSAFKKLMATDNDTDRENARYFVGTVLGEEIIEIDYLPQEYSYHSTKSEIEFKSEVERLKIMRLDFVATIRTRSGETKRLLIEIQRSNNPSDLLRFRGYIGEQYQQNEQITINDRMDEQAMPIVVIYMLGFNLSGIDTIAMKVSRTYVDLLNPSATFSKNPYIECLSHDCYYIQVARINAETYADWDKCSELLQMLSLFEQDYFVNTEKSIKKYPYTITNKNIKKMIDTLEYIAADPVMRKIMKEEYWASLNEKVWKSQAETMASEIADLSCTVETLSSENAAQSSELAAQSGEIAELRRLLQQSGISIPATLNPTFQ